MNAKEKSTQKMVLVRNTEQILPAVKVSDSKLNTKQLNPQRETKKVVEIKIPSRFDKPQSHSMESIHQKMKRLNTLKPNKVKSISDLDKNQHLIRGEKITKQVNFPYEQQIYKDLIPLCVKMQSQPMISSREPLPLKDIEPVLSDFFNPRKIPEYTYTASSQIEDKVQIEQFRGLKLHRVMQTWCNND